MLSSKQRRGKRGGKKFSLSLEKQLKTQKPTVLPRARKQPTAKLEEKNPLGLRKGNIPEKVAPETSWVPGSGVTGIWERLTARRGREWHDSGN